MGSSAARFARAMQARVEMLAHTEDDRHATGNLIEDDARTLNHLVVIEHVELGVAAEREDAVHAVLDHEIDLAA